MKYASFPVYSWPDEQAFSRVVYEVENFAIKMFVNVKAWRSRSRLRRPLTQYTDYQLKDIGVSRVDTWAEAAKPFWKA